MKPDGKRRGLWLDLHPAKTLRFSTYFLWGAALLLPLVGYFAWRVRFGTSEVQAWLPGEDSARVRYKQFLEQFGDDQILFVSWPGCKLDDPRLEAMMAGLQRLRSEEPDLGIAEVQDPRSMMELLLVRQSSIDVESATERLQGIALGKDGSCFLSLQLNEAGNLERARLIRQIRATAVREIGVSADDLILAGEPFQVFIIDQASRETIQYFVAPSSVLSLLLAWVCLRSVKLTILVFVLSGIGQLIGLALISIFLGEMSAVLVVLPTLIFMLTLSAAIHLTNYYRDCGGEQVDSAGVSALSLGARPCLLATLTTVFGFGSLVVSQLKPVWHFGSLASLGLLMATVLLLAVFPAATSYLSSTSTAQLRSRGSFRKLPQVHNAVSSWLASWTNRHAMMISSIGIVALVASAVGIGRLKTSTEFEDMFPSSSPAIKSLHWMQEHLGPISSLEFVVEFPQPNGTQSSSDSFDILQKARLIEQIHRSLVDSPHISSVLSTFTFLPSVPNSNGTRSTIRRAVLRRTFEAHVEDLRGNHLIADLPGVQAWRLSARVRDISGKDFREVQHDLSQIVQACIDTQLLQDRPSDATQQAISFHVTGLRTVIEKAHFAILSDLSSSFATAFLLIAPVMMLIVRGFVGGLLLMLPNVLPVALVFGCMGWLGVKLDVASILTASVALGIAVDDTIHFVAWFTRCRQSGDSPSDAVRQSIAACARPMLHTSIICTGSMLPFFFSDFLPTSKFALLMILILSGAIVGDLILLPAILQCPLGRSIGAAGRRLDT